MSKTGQQRFDIGKIVELELDPLVVYPAGETFGPTFFLGAIPLCHNK